MLLLSRICLLALLCLVQLSEGLQQRKEVYRVGMGVFRAQAESVVLPKYPPSSIAAKHEGRVVIEVLTSPSGKVTDTRLLETPDEAIGNAVSNAVARWSFHPFFVKDAPQVIKGRLLFYFRIVHAKPIVIDAIAESPLYRSTPH